MPRKFLIAFLVAAPIGVLLGLAAAAFLPPTLAAAAFDLFLAFILVGALGLVIAYRPSQRSWNKITSMAAVFAS